ncbi:putative zinc-finger domain-containing protein [Cynara cardunculus var. scolymus]|uniref:Putative zinc-finger domain-containing protein n=1 Tax=Cynara cardunculus var. scolymus TaxID=59895 RepID=A0A103YD62_CYNCS|nr:putative zinc-finger domain-containing protein [Cynara cardunculus var. scolymus]
MVENATTTSSPPTTSNHDTNAKVLTNTSKMREEGELSASENEEFAGSQFPESTTLPGALLNKDNDVVEMGKSVVTHNPTSSAVARTSVHLNNRKGTEKYRVPFVISFSDDDSGSDSEGERKGNTMDSDDTTRGVIENRKLSTSLGNSRLMQQTAKTNTRIPKNFSTSRTFVSSMNRVNGTSFKSGGGTFVGPKSQPKKSSAPGKNKVGQNVHINSSKLQDLRQLIAIRENELKSRAGKHDKEVASSSLKNSANATLKSTAVRSRDSAERLLVEPKEPEKKRLKVSEPPTNTLISVGQHDRPSTESTLVARISALESDGLKGRYDGNYCDKEILTGTRQSSAMQQINTVKNHTPSTNLPSGTSIVRNSRRHNRITNLAESSAPLTAKTSPHRQVRGCLNNSSFWNHFGATNMSKTGDMDIKSLLEIEELQDKELDEAQEHRRKCEIEERNALKAYRKAQRALVEANARCSYLYHKRELFSANLHSHVMEDSSMFWSNMPLEHTGAHVNTMTNMSENNMHLVPISRHQLQNDFHLRDQHQYGLNVRSTDDLREDGKNLVSESCGEPDTSASEPQEEEKTNDVCSSLHETNTLGEDEQTSAFELKAGDSSLDSQGEGICSERTKEINDDTMTLDPTEDSLLLEATLRSQLFARLGIKTSKKNELGQSMETAVEREDGEIMEGAGNIPSPETEKDQLNDFEGTYVGRSEKSISEYPMGIKDQCPAEKFSVNNGSSLAEPILRSSFGYAKFTSDMNSMPSHTKNLQIHTNDIYDEKKVVDGVCGATLTDIVSNANKNSLLDMYVPEVGSCSNNLAINPFWPFCMFELRGKCNDDDCRWQHLKDYSSRSIDCNNSDNVLGSSLQMRNGATIVSKCLGSLPLAPPTYLVCLDSLKGDSHPYKYLVAHTVKQRWQKYFSASLVVSSSLLGDLHSDEPCLHGPEARIEIHGVWNRQSSFFHGKNVKEWSFMRLASLDEPKDAEYMSSELCLQPLGLSDQLMDDTNQPLEIALLTLSREVNKQKGRREALIVIARALEEHPTSALLWIVYLHIYYGNQKSIGNDDLILALRYWTCLPNGPNLSFLNMLNRYLTDSRALPPSEPLSRSFIKSIRNPKTQKLVNDLLTPISSDFSLVNLVLESCFGPSLLPPQSSERVTDIVDFAEALMEMRPGNYQLALCICKTYSGVNASISFWASAVLMDSLFQAVPVAPESVWVEAAGMLKRLADFTSMLESFHKRALSVYPYSMRLWKSYVGLYGNNSDEVNRVMEMARKKGIKLLIDQIGGWL